MPQHTDPMPGADELFQSLRVALGYPQSRLPLLIGIDGWSGAGKSSLASWLAWQLGMPAVSLDLYIIRDTEPLEWRLDDLRQTLNARAEIGRPIIVEGICLCQVLRAIDRDPDYLVWVENDGGPEPNPDDPTGEYVREFTPKLHAQHVLRWDQNAATAGSADYGASL